MRLFLSLGIVLGCGYLGLAAAAKADARVRQLEVLQEMMNGLLFYVGFLTLPFAEALARTAQGRDGVAAKTFAETAKRMQRYPEQSPKESFCVAVRRNGLCLKAEETETLCAFFERVVRGDRDAVIDGIRMTSAKLCHLTEVAAAARDKDGRLCRGLGFLGGIFVVILFF